MIDFPANPTNGQEYTYLTRTWVWAADVGTPDRGAWNIKPVSTTDANLAASSAASAHDDADDAAASAAEAAATLADRPTRTELALPGAANTLGYTRASGAEVKIQQALRDLEAAYAGMKTKIVAGVLRNYGTVGAPDWRLIADGNHTQMNCGTVLMNGKKLQLNFAANYKKAISFIVAPDETLAAQGFTAGASVGTGNVLIECGQKMQGYVNLSSGAVTLNEPTYWAGADITAAVSAGVVTITHPSNGGFQPYGFVKEPGAPYRIPTLTFRKISDLQTSIHPYRMLGGYARCLSGVWSLQTMTVAGCTIAESGGLVTITHPAVDAATPPLLTTRDNDSVLAEHDSYTATTFQVRFRDYAGVAVTTPSDKMRFAFCRPDFLPAGAAVNGEAYFDLGYGTIDMGKLVALGGNLWFIGVFEDN